MTTWSVRATLPDMDDFEIDDDDPVPTMTAPNCRYPNVIVQLTGADSGTGPIMSRVVQAMEEAEVPRAEINEFRTNVLFVGNYNEVLQYVMSWVSVR